MYFWNNSATPVRFFFQTNIFFKRRRKIKKYGGNAIKPSLPLPKQRESETDREREREEAIKSEIRFLRTDYNQKIKYKAEFFAQRGNNKSYKTCFTFS
jgi:hypothetical protein